MSKSCPLKAQDLPAAKAKELVNRQDGKARLVQFHSPSCPHCSEVTPEIDKVAKELCGATDVCRINVDSIIGDKLADALGIEGLPTVAVLRDGKVLEHLEGAGPTAADFSKLLAKYLKS